MLRTRSYGLLLQPLPEELVDSTPRSLGESVSAAGGESCSRGKSHSVTTHLNPNGHAVFNNNKNSNNTHKDDNNNTSENNECDVEDSYICHCSSCVEEEKELLAGHSRGAAPQESSVFREP
ncbi:hypothetical protein LSM04_005607 [Trypanosoma melophagium]|uniref:uncharacterized protein n=1 Tax=Trypanosoma melophagium TaxID=715481 RepID=UPI00351A79E5|nr:hypothetical protein LSM04_005607 [Trypanosoma melophagium]